MALNNIQIVQLKPEFLNFNKHCNIACILPKCQNVTVFQNVTVTYTILQFLQLYFFTKIASIANIMAVRNRKAAAAAHP